MPFGGLLTAAIIGAGGSIGAAALSRGGSKESKELRELYEAQTAVSKEQLSLAKILEGLSVPQLQQYIAYLNKMVSSDPNVRFSAVGPAAQDVTAQYEAARKNIEAMPRSGERDQLLAQTYQGQARDIGRLIDEAYTSAQTAKGQVGEWGISGAVSALGGAATTLTGAASTALSAEQVATQGRQDTLAAISQIIAGLAGGWGTGQYGTLGGGGGGGGGSSGAGGYTTPWGSASTPGFQP